jgi:hypothetical protein
MWRRTLYFVKISGKRRWIMSQSHLTLTASGNALDNMVQVHVALPPLHRIVIIPTCLFLFILKAITTDGIETDNILIQS